jgi:lipoate-protein ligase A
VSDDWIFGKIKKFDFQLSHRFSWGGTEVCLAVDDAKIIDAKIYTDALDTEIFEKIAHALTGINYAFAAIEKSLSPFEDTKVKDIENLIKERLFYGKV